jgi:ADP-ribosylglycohydrolase
VSRKRSDAPLLPLLASDDERAAPVEPQAAPRSGESREIDVRQRAAALSALWAAWGDAVGWISELTDEAGLHRRTKGRPLNGPVPWTRKIGGRGGVNVQLPSGTYSDDTQLRLAVCRAHGPRGFDPEVFSAVELTVWPSYALGGGTGTKAAAVSMAKPGARWSANRPPNYVEAGGNGAAMRAQPHAWRTTRPVIQLLTDVMRDAVSTHGHPNGIVGAALSALAIADCMPGGEGRLLESGTSAWEALLAEAALIAEIAEEDAELGAYWLPHWKHPDLGPWPQAVEVTIERTRAEARSVRALIDTSSGLVDGYRKVLSELDLRSPARRGSGVHTVLGALSLVALAVRHGVGPRDVLLCAARELGTDTDTIATMAGGVLGCRADEAPADEILDASYIAAEAKRVAAPRAPAPSTFTYPDLLVWQPPKTQADALQELDGNLIVVGLGPATALADPITLPRSDFSWQWVRLETTQTLLIKRRSELRTAHASAFPASPAAEPAADPDHAPITRHAGKYRDDGTVPRAADPSRSSQPQMSPIESSLGKVRSSNFDVRVIGTQLARLARDESAAVAAAFGALVANELAAMRQRDHR